MNFFTEMSVLEQIFFWIAAAASLFLIIQIILLLVSFGGGDLDADGDADFDGDGDADTDGGLSLFSVKSITAFFALGGWCGYAAANGMPENYWAPVLIFLAAGIAALLAVAFAMRGVAKLQCSGNLVAEKLTGKNATVYVSVPALRQGRGKVTLTAQGKYMELDAVTDDREKIQVDEEVTILSYTDDFAVVERKNKTE